MDRDNLPAEIKDFVMNYLDSVGKLEVLLLLSANPDKSWSCTSVSRELRSTDISASKYLDELAQAGLVKKTDGTPAEYLYAPQTEELRKTVSNVTSTYAIYPVRIIHHIINRPVHKIQSFADAFRIRKSENSDDS